MKLICIGNFPPRKCGIATFTQNLINSIKQAATLASQNMEVEIITMNEADANYEYPPEVKFKITDNKKSTYQNAVDYIKASDASLCLVQHEYGIYGGNSGLLLLELMKNIQIPIVTTLHTVLDKPSFHQKEILKQIGKYSSKLVVMNTMAIPHLKHIYNVPEGKIAHIEHGVPDFEKFNISQEKPAHWKDKTVILTFGLLGRNKGLDTMIRSLSRVVVKNPNVLYVILGKTHPHVKKHAGEEYRDYLKQTTKQLNLENHVEFIDEFVSEADLVYYLHHANIYVTPYLNKEQITSGTLVYAIAGGCAVVSTPYWHAEEILTQDLGKLFDFKNHQKLSTILNELISNPQLTQRLQKNAHAYGTQITWVKIGEKYLNLIEKTSNHTKTSASKKNIYEPYFSHHKTKHFEFLTDDMGIIQHAIGSIPDLKKGYSLDDNARAINVCLHLYQQEKNEKYINLIYKYLAFILYMQHPNGSFYNFISYNRTIQDKIVPDDTFGRVMWAMGMLVRFSPTSMLHQNAHRIIGSCLPHFENLRYVRGYANTILGLYHYIHRYPDQEEFIARLKTLADKLVDQFDITDKNWTWFEPILNYDNALLPAALYAAFEITGNPTYLEVAYISRKFLESKCIIDGHLSLIGNKTWWVKGQERSYFAQQPVDAMAMTVMYDHAFKATYDISYMEKLSICHEWFYGLNDLNMPLYDDFSQGCNDGLEEFEVNQNQGSESIIAFLISECIYLQYNKKVMTTNNSVGKEIIANV